MLFRSSHATCGKPFYRDTHIKSQSARWKCLGLLDTLLNKEKKLLEKSRKELARVDALEKTGRSSEAIAELEKTSAMLKENMIFIGKMRLDFYPVFSDLGNKFLRFDRAQMAQDAAKVSLQLDPKNPVAPEA